MRLQSCVWTFALMLFFFDCSMPTSFADRPASNVPPTLEIEILDPNADPLSRPAVELEQGVNGNMIVNIPPTVLVHRYYFTGERSFQAQLLPGGPTIVVANHPKTGERVYIDVQMPPGAPRVTYTDHAIEYDFGATGVSVCFGLLGNPTIKYRSGPSLQSRVGKLIGFETIKDRAQTSQENLRQAGARTKMMTYGAVATVTETTGQVLTPVKTLLETMPFGKMAFDPTRGDKLIQTADQHKRDHEIKQFEKQRRYEELTRKTVR